MNDSYGYRYDDDDRYDYDNDDGVLYPLTSALLSTRAALTSTIPTTTTSTTTKTRETSTRETVDFTPTPDELWSRIGSGTDSSSSPPGNDDGDRNGGDGLRKTNTTRGTKKTLVIQFDGDSLDQGSRLDSATAKDRKSVAEL